MQKDNINIEINDYCDNCKKRTKFILKKKSGWYICKKCGWRNPEDW